jgi:hypothetical protein
MSENLNFSIYSDKENEDNSYYVFKYPFIDSTTDNLTRYYVDEMMDVCDYISQTDDYLSTNPIIYRSTKMIKKKKYDTLIDEDFCGTGMSSYYLVESFMNNNMFGLFRFIKTPQHLLHSVLTYYFKDNSIVVDAFCTNQTDKLKGGNILLSRLIDICILTNKTEIKLESVPKSISYYEHQGFSKTGKITHLTEMVKPITLSSSKAYQPKLDDTDEITEKMVELILPDKVDDISIHINEMLDDTYLNNLNEHKEIIENKLNNNEELIKDNLINQSAGRKINDIITIKLKRKNVGSESLLPFSNNLSYDSENTFQKNKGGRKKYKTKKNKTKKNKTKKYKMKKYKQKNIK